MVNGGMHALENLSRGIMHLISNKKSYFLRDNNFFSAFLSHVEKKKRKESDGSFLPFLPGGHIQVKDKARFNHSYIADD